MGINRPEARLSTSRAATAGDIRLAAHQPAPPATRAVAANTRGSGLRLLRRARIDDGLASPPAVTAEDALIRGLIHALEEPGEMSHERRILSRGSGSSGIPRGTGKSGSLQALVTPDGPPATGLGVCASVLVQWHSSASPRPPPPAWRRIWPVSTTCRSAPSWHGGCAS